MTIREITTSEELNEDVRKLMSQFWDEYDELFINMDKLTKNEYEKRLNHMWNLRNKASEISGDYFLISLYGLEEKSRKLFGDELPSLPFN